jgi:hypothetical protein
LHSQLKVLRCIPLLSARDIPPRLDLHEAIQTI